MRKWRTRDFWIQSFLVCYFISEIKLNNKYCSDQQNEIIKLKDKIKDLEIMLVEGDDPRHNGELGELIFIFILLFFPFYLSQLYFLKIKPCSERRALTRTLMKPSIWPELTGAFPCTMNRLNSAGTMRTLFKLALSFGAFPLFLSIFPDLHYL